MPGLRVVNCSAVNDVTVDGLGLLVSTKYKYQSISNVNIRFGSEDR